MASYHLSVKAIGRSQGRSATGAAAYRAAERIHDARTGELFDYSRKRGVEHREIVVPEAAPSWALQRERLWNAAESAERRKNSTVAREFEVALPAEITASQRRELAVGFARELVQRHGFVADVAIHQPHRVGDHRNHHAHILCSTRRLAGEGFTDKTRELDDRKSGEVEYWRGRWAEVQNAYLKAHGHEARVDHRSLEAQGIDRAPTQHKGPAITGMERRGIQTEVGSRLAAEQRLEIQARLECAAQLGRIERERAGLARSILDLSGDLAAAKRAREVQHTPEHTTAMPAPNQEHTLEERFRERVEGRAEQLQEEWTAERKQEEQRQKLRQEQNLEREQEIEKPHGRDLDLNLGD